MRFIPGRPSDAAPDGATRSARESARSASKTKDLPPQYPRLAGDHRARPHCCRRRSDLERGRASGVAARPGCPGAPILVGAGQPVAGPYRAQFGVCAERSDRGGAGESSHGGPTRHASSASTSRTTSSRRANSSINRQTFGPKGAFAADHLGLLSLRRSVDNGTATPAQIETFFNSFGAQVDASLDTHAQRAPAHADLGFPVDVGTSDRPRRLVQRVHLRARRREPAGGRLLGDPLRKRQHACGNPESHHQPSEIHRRDARLSSFARPQERRGVVGLDPQPPLDRVRGLCATGHHDRPEP